MVHICTFWPLERSIYFSSISFVIFYWKKNTSCKNFAIDCRNSLPIHTYIELLHTARDCFIECQKLLLFNTILFFLLHSVSMVYLEFLSLILVSSLSGFGLDTHQIGQNDFFFSCITMGQKRIKSTKSDSSFKFKFFFLHFFGDRRVSESWNHPKNGFKMQIETKIFLPLNHNFWHILT